jgi:hypothetical protein
MELTDAVVALQKFGGEDLTRTLAKIELSLIGTTNESCSNTLSTCGAEDNVLGAAGLIKHLAGQVNVIIHALGILLCLPHLLQPGETIEYASLGAGNTGKAFDLETNQRIAEFKFIRWQGGAEAIRQNALFKDFYLMAEHSSDKQKFLYVLGIEHPLRFFNSGRSLSSVLNNVKLQNQFFVKFGEKYRTVRDYYVPRKDFVLIRDVSSFVPNLFATGISSDEASVSDSLS